MTSSVSRSPFRRNNVALMRDTLAIVASDLIRKQLGSEIQLKQQRIGTRELRRVAAAAARRTGAEERRSREREGRHRGPQSRLPGGGFFIRGGAGADASLGGAGVDARRAGVPSLASRRQRPDARAKMDRARHSARRSRDRSSIRTARTRTRFAATCATGAGCRRSRPTRRSATQICTAAQRRSREGDDAQPQPGRRVGDAVASVLPASGRDDDRRRISRRSTRSTPTSSCRTRTSFSRGCSTPSYDLGQFDKAKQWCNVSGQRFPSDVRAVRCRLYLLTTRIESAECRAGLARSPTPRRRWSRRPRRARDQLKRGHARRRGDRAREQADSRRSPTARGTSYSAHWAMRRSIRPAISPTSARLYTRCSATTSRRSTCSSSYVAASPSRAASLRDDAGWYFRDIAQDPRFRRAVSAP